MRIARSAAIAMLAILAAGIAPRAAAAPPRVRAGRDESGRSAPTEYDVKAAFIVSFTRFVEWPAGSPEPSIVVIEPDPFGSALETAASDPTLAAPMTVRLVHAGDAAPPCRIAFAGRASGEKGAASALGLGPGVLTIGETEDFLARGGVIRLALAEGRVKVEINMDAAERSGLRLSSKLLKIATLRRESEMR
jgi:hypothetical protein